jgi:hypothetical protein
VSGLGCWWDRRKASGDGLFGQLFGKRKKNKGGCSEIGVFFFLKVGKGEKKADLIMKFLDDLLKGIIRNKGGQRVDGRDIDIVKFVGVREGDGARFRLFIELIRVREEAVADGPVSQDELTMEPGGEVGRTEEGGVEARRGDRRGREPSHQA